ncbi:hypothetical protein CAPSP0001_2210 [Capnocytophaga sputigena ATCC 33612]|nr:hypothetical protein CAPSP0001_2210 [Capnocytophaga sputigena ATCC 33612]
MGSFFIDKLTNWGIDKFFVSLPHSKLLIVKYVAIRKKI